MTDSSFPLQESILTSTVFAAVLAAALGYAWRTWRQAYLGYWAVFWALYVAIWSLYVTAYAPAPEHEAAAAVALAVATLASFTARTALALGIASYLGLRPPNGRERRLIAAVVVGLTIAVIVLRRLLAGGLVPAAAIVPFRPYFLGLFLDVTLAAALLRPHRGAVAPRGRGVLTVALLLVAASDALDVFLEAWSGIGWLAAPDALLRFSAIGLHVCDSLLAAGMMIAAIGTEHARAERSAADLRAREVQLQQAQRLETVGQLAGGVAHDLNNLLTVMVGSLAFVRDTLPAGSQALGDVDAASSAATRAARLTRQLLTFARRHPVEPRVVDVAASVRALKPLLPALVGAQVKLAIRLAPARATIWIDPTQLEQLLLNLVVNARDAMPNGGTLTIETSSLVTAPPGDPEAWDVPDGAWVRISVEDTGEGMDEPTRARIFEPYFTTKAPGRGSGLGLAVVHGIVEQAQGHVTVRSAPGAGTRFAIFLPLRDGDVVQPRAATAHAGRGHETILVVDDDPLVRATTERALAARGYAVLGAGSGEEALALAESRLRDVAALVTDVVMPGMDGIALAAALRARRPSLPVLLVSGYAPGLSDPALPHGLSARRLTKPFEPDQLAAEVRELIDAAA